MAELKSLADAPGTLREYETIYILKPDTLNERVAEINRRVREIIESREGKVLKIDNWGKRRLAYEVKKQLKGIYLYWSYLGTPAIVREFERNMRMLDPVIRYMTVKLEANIDPATRESEVDEEAYERAANTAADEEDLMVRRAEPDEGEESEAAEASSTEASSTEASSTEASSTEASSTEASSTEASSTEAAGKSEDEGASASAEKSSEETASDDESSAKKEEE